MKFLALFISLFAFVAFAERAPALISNGDISMTVDAKFSTAGLPKSNLSSGMFRAGRRITQPSRELLSQGHWAQMVTQNGAPLKPLVSSQTLDLTNAVTTCRNTFAPGLEVTSRAFAPLNGGACVVLEQTACNTSSIPVSCSLGIVYTLPTHARITFSRVTPLADSVDCTWRTYAYHTIDTCVNISSPGATPQCSSNQVTLAHSLRLAPHEQRSFTTTITITDNLFNQDSVPRDTSYAAHTNAWHAYYSESFVEMPDAELQAMALMAAYHLRCDATRWSFPVGIFHSHWQGLYFGFDSMYMFEGLISAGHFATSRREPDFRFAQLPSAIARNKYNRNDHKYGARWYWEATEEAPVSSSYVEGSVNGIWLDHIFHMANIARSAWLQYRYTRDETYLREQGYPLILQCARYFRNNWVYEAGEDSAFIGRCTDLERLGAARNRPFMTTCGAIYTLRIAAAAAQILATNQTEAADFSATASRLVKGLPQRDDRYIAYIPERDEVLQESVGTLAGFSPYPIFPATNSLQRAAVQHFMKHGSASGNMYPMGKRICPWYAAKMAVALQAMQEAQAAFEWLKVAAASKGEAFGEFWEINEPAVQLHPYFTTAAGSTLFAINRMFVTDDEATGRTLVAVNVPPAWRDFAFRLPCQQGAFITMRRSNGITTLLEAHAIRPSDRGKSITLYLPTPNSSTLTPVTLSLL